MWDCTYSTCKRKVLQKCKVPNVSPTAVSDNAIDVNSLSKAQTVARPNDWQLCALEDERGLFLLPRGAV